MKFPIKTKIIKNRHLAFPKDTKELSKIVRFAFKNKINIIPLGGETNRVGGTTSNINETIYINFKNMNKVIDIDEDNLIATVESGALLEKINEKVQKKGLFFPVNIAPSDLCTIGGNISTNVGGLQTLRYGNIENNINGLEVVLSDGTILNLQSKLKKDNFGPKLWKIFCGSEGIFGIITKANLKLIPKKKYKTTYLVEVKNLSQSIHLFKDIRKYIYDNLISFEIVFPLPLSILLNKKTKNIALIIEINSNEKNNYHLQTLKIFKKYFAKIIRLEKNLKNSKIWKQREKIVYNQNDNNFNHKFDISLPLNNWEKFIREINSFIKSNNQFTPYFFGHLGDGNLHCNFKIEPDTESNLKKLSNFIFNLTLKLNGSVAAEHGLGMKKNDLILKYKSKEYIKFLTNYKKHLDPNLILGKGKLFKTP